MHQYIGLILLMIAVAAGLYIVTNTEDLFNLRFGIPLDALPSPINLPDDDGGLKSDSAPVISKHEVVRISSIRVGDRFNSYKVRLSSNLSRDEEINISGWTLKSENGTFTIPTAQEVYSFGGTQGDIKLGYGDYIHLYSEKAVKGNFRLNKCLGYIEYVAPFIPSLPKKCPRISRSEITKFSSKCQDYLLSLGICERLSANPPIPLDDYTCHEFLQELNYTGCVERYGNDSDFLSREWRIWADDAINIFDPLHDRVQLLDKTGTVIDEYTY